MAGIWRYPDGGVWFGGYAVVAIEVVVPHPGPRLWQKILVERLRAAGHDVSIAHERGAARWPLLMRTVLAFERRLFRRRKPGLSSIAHIPETPATRTPELRLDLSGVAPAGATPTLRLAFDGDFSDAAMVLAVADGRLPTIEAVLDDASVVGRALPMLDKRESTALGVNDVLARAMTLALSMVDRFDRGWDREVAAPRSARPGPVDSIRLASSYLLRGFPRLCCEGLRRLLYRQAHWVVGYRFLDGPGVAATGRLGDNWQQLADPGDRFYADPFPFEWQGRSFIFVEDYPHATKKAVISVVEFGEDGTPSAPRVVLEEPFHLSYPQVFAWNGDIWMLPEGSGGGKLTLYRAAQFPDRWVAEHVLLEGQISDATLLEHDGRWWLFATNRDGFGSTSDTMAVFWASSPVGPWTQHAQNPILIDRRAARPGGAFVRVGGRVLLPVQDGTRGYGGGLGLSELLELTVERVRLSAPQAVVEEGDWPYPQIHTLNRVGRLEVIDGIAAVRK